MHPFEAAPLLPDAAHRRRTVTSREYRIALNARRFGSWESAALECVEVLKRTVHSHGMKFVLADASPVQRRTWFLDTADEHLYESNLSLQVVEYGAGNERFRIRLGKTHHDRHLAVINACAAPDGFINELTECMLPTHSVYANSWTVACVELPPLGTIDGAIRLLPASMPCLLPRRRETLETVNGITATELVIPMGRASSDDHDPPLAFELTVTSFDGSGAGGRTTRQAAKPAPAIVVLTLRYPNLPGSGELERFAGGNVTAGHRLYELLCSEHDGTSADNRTLLEAVYGRQAG